MRLDRKRRPSSKLDSRSEPANMVQVGEITAPQGLDGSVRVYLTTDHPEFLPGYRALWPEAMEPPLEVIACRLQGSMAVLRFRTVNSREEAEALRNTRLYLPLERLPRLPEGEYYWHQLLGLTVKERFNGQVIGRLAHILKTGANDVFEVARDEKPPLLVPALKSVVREIDMEHRQMWVDLPDGLEDLP